jgi:hypothetical protein
VPENFCIFLSGHWSLKHIPSLFASFAERSIASKGQESGQGIGQDFVKIFVLPA